MSGLGSEGIQLPGVAPEIVQLVMERVATIDYSLAAAEQAVFAPQQRPTRPVIVPGGL